MKKCKCKIKKGIKSSEEYGHAKHVNFSDFTGEMNLNEYQRGVPVIVSFDEKSVRLLPAQYVKECKNMGYDPYSYAFNCDEVECISITVLVE